MKSTTDKQRLDFLQRLSRRRDKAVGFNSLVSTVPLSASLNIESGGFYVMLRDKFGRGDDGAFRRSRKTLRSAIDAAMKEFEAK
jgi:hypothetical protein